VGEVHTNPGPHQSIDRSARGRVGEKAAAAYLTERGYRVLAVNQRTPAGEIDIVCRRHSCVVIVEVKARSSRAYGTGLEAVGSCKARRLRAAALWWLSDRGLLPCEIRFDVISVLLDRQGLPRRIEHLENVIEGAS
jgi:putative endonuclease